MLRGIGVLGILIAIGLALAAYGITGRELYDGDCFAYAEAAQQILQGEKLYSETWQDKPPVAILFYLVPQLVAPGSPIALQLWLGFWQLLQVAILLALAGPTASFLQRGVTAAFVLLLPLTSQPLVWASTEHVANLFLLVVLLASLNLIARGTSSRPLFFLTGLCLALAFNTRQNTILFSLLPLLALLTSRESRRRTALLVISMAAGFVAGFLVVLIAVLAVSDLHGYWDTVFSYPRRYSTIHLGRQTLKDLADLVRGLLDMPLGTVVLLLGSLNIFDRWIRSWRILCFVIAALALAVVACVLPLKPYPHYWANLLPLIAVFALALLEGESRLLGRPRPVLCAALLLFLCPFATNTLVKAWDSETLTRLDLVAQEVNRQTVERDRLFVVARWDAASYLCFTTKAKEAHRFFWCLQLDPYWSEILPVPIDKVLSDYKENPPTIIVAARDCLSDTACASSNKTANAKRLVDLYVAQHTYKEVASRSGFTILRRDCRAPLETGLARGFGRNSSPQGICPLNHDRVKAARHAGDGCKRTPLV